MKEREIARIIFATFAASALLSMNAAGFSLTTIRDGVDVFTSPVLTVIDEAATTWAKMWMIGATWDLYNFLTSVYANLKDLILANPPVEGPNGFKPTQGFFVSLAQPFQLRATFFCSRDPRRDGPRRRQSLYGCCM
jgi:hypothetical protein